MFGFSAKIDFASVGFGEFNTITKFYKSNYYIKNVSEKNPILTPSTSTFTVYKNFKPKPQSFLIKSIIFGIFNLMKTTKQFRKIKTFAKIYYRKRSRIKKRFNENPAKFNNVKKTLTTTTAI